MTTSLRYGIVAALLAALVIPAAVEAAPEGTSATQYKVYKYKYKKYYAHPAGPKPYYRRPPTQYGGHLLGLGIRGDAILLEGEKLALSTLENPTMAGLGIFFRGKVAPNWGLELSFDYLQASEEDYTQTTMPLMLSAMFYLFPKSRLSPYVVAGGGLHFTKLSYFDDLYRHDLVEVAGQVGGGIDIRLMDSLALYADLRILGVYKNIGEADQIRTDCAMSLGEFCSLQDTYDEDDKFNLGMQLSGGVIFYF